MAHKVSFVLACRAVGFSVSCYRYIPTLTNENDEIANLVAGLTDARKTGVLGPCVLHLHNVKRHRCNHLRVFRI